VLYVGVVLENASQEREKVGDEWQAKYTLSQLLEPKFRLPRKGSSNQTSNSGGLRAIAVANPGIVGRWKEQPKAA
jgi:hypothetical protein